MESLNSQGSSTSPTPTPPLPQSGHAGLRALALAAVLLFAAGLAVGLLHPYVQLAAVLRWTALCLFLPFAVRRRSLLIWTFFAMLAGAELGVDAPSIAAQTHFLADIFLRLIRMIVAPLIFGGIVTGIFTATESGAIACLYALVLTTLYYRELKFSQLPEIIRKVALTCGMVFFLIATSSAFGWIMAYERIPQTVAAGIASVTREPFLVLLIVNLFILIVGFFMDMAASILILTPIFLPIAQSIGMHPVQFGIMLLLNLAIGLIHPPVGTALFVGCAIAKCSLESTVKAILMFIPVLILVLLLVTYVPALTMTLPKIFMP